MMIEERSVFNATSMLYRHNMGQQPEVKQAYGMSPAVPRSQTYSAGQVPRWAAATIYAPTWQVTFEVI